MYIFIYKYVPTNNYSFIDIDDVVTFTCSCSEKKKRLKTCAELTI